jgi:hypothetical protein
MVGCRVLIVEDEAVIAGSTGGLETALSLADEGTMDAAINRA